MRVERITGLMDNGRAKLWVRVDGKVEDIESYYRSRDQPIAH
jgi:hypothetical protein